MLDGDLDIELINWLRKHSSFLNQHSALSWLFFTPRLGDINMGWLSAIIIGAIIGWIAEKVMKSDMGLFMNIVIGIIGSSLGRWVFGDILNIGSAHTAGSFSFSGLLFGVLGASLLIYILRFFKLRK